jgi:TraM recognition site of TraD and TraG/YWFCY protein
MEENASQQKWYGFTIMFIYVFIALDWWMHTLSNTSIHHPIVRVLIEKLWKIPVLAHPIYSHLLVIGLIAIVSWAAKGRKDIAFEPWRQVVLPGGLGLGLISGSLLFLPLTTGMSLATGYGLCYLFGSILLQAGLSNLTKYIPTRLKQDIWNVEEESFEQNRTYIESRELFNIPMQFYYRLKVHNGWININPFRGLMVLGTPGSGKSESVIVPFIKQFLGKGYAMLVYDFKYPTLARIAWHHYRLHHRPGGALEHHRFHIINLDDIAYSHRINPLHARYIRSLADAGETAEAIVTALKKGEKGGGGGSDQFFTQSAINFLSSAIYFLAGHEQGKYSTLPHLLAFIAQPYEKIFKCLFSMIELNSLLSPFYSAFQKGAFDQLEGQIGTLRINISRLATKETFWVFTGDDFDLKISNPPSVLVLANSPNSQNVNSAFFSAILLRTIRLVNEPGNHPCALVVDELPTLYMHKLDNLIATARSNKVAVVLGLQEVTQLQQLQGKETAATITSIMGSVLSGAVRSKETLDWLERMFGKVKQVSQGMNIDRSRTGINFNEKMDQLIPAAKIANQNTGELVGVVARENQDQYGPYQSNTFRCKVTLDLKQIDEEKRAYQDVPMIYQFGVDEEREAKLMANMQQIYKEVEELAVSE